MRKGNWIWRSAKRQAWCWRKKVDLFYVLKEVRRVEKELEKRIEGEMDFVEGRLQGAVECIERTVRRGEKMRKEEKK